MWPWVIVFILVSLIAVRIRRQIYKENLEDDLRDIGQLACSHDPEDRHLLHLKDKE
jgi:hypothetical protein